MARHVDHVDAARYRQRPSICKMLFDADRFHRFFRAPEQPEHDRVPEPWCRRHGPKRTPCLGEWHIERVHIGSSTCLAHDGFSAADVVRMAVSENKML